MEEKEGTQQKETKILKCVKCGKVYIFDSVSEHCPDCHGALRKETIVAVEHPKEYQVKIRPMEAGDIDVVFEIDRRLTGIERAITHAELITGDLGETLDLSFVAEVSNQVVGFILARHAYVGEPVVEAGLIQGLGVHPDYSRHGIATKLVNSLLDRCRSKGPKTVRVILSERDSRMEGLFSYMGFRRAQLIVFDKIL
jgi:predicted N-acetyltransferase YhbS